MLVEIEVHKACEGEAEESSCEYEPEDEVGGFAEADGVVYLAGPGIEAISWGTCGCSHDVDWIVVTGLLLKKWKAR